VTCVCYAVFRCKRNAILAPSTEGTFPYLKTPDSLTIHDSISISVISARGHNTTKRTPGLRGLGYR
jgi:hypothetical protein